MAKMDYKGSLSPALTGLQTALSVIAHGLEHGDDTRFIFEEKDFLQDCFDASGHADLEKLNNQLGDYISIDSEDMADRFEQKLSEANISHCVMGVVKKEDKNQERFKISRDAKEPVQEEEINADLERWFVFSKDDIERASNVLHQMEAGFNEHQYPVDQMIRASKSPMKPFELSIMDNVDNRLIRAMQEDRHVSKFYSVIEGPEKSAIVYPSIYKSKLTKNLMTTLGNISGQERKMRSVEEQRRYDYANKHMLRVVDDRKPFFVANLEPDGKTFNEGIVVDANGVRRLFFTKDKTYVVENHPRNLSSFAPYAADLISKYRNPGYLELTGRSIQRDDIVRNQDKIVADGEWKEEKPQTKNLVFAQKNYLIQHYLVPIMEKEISGTTREEMLGRIRSAKWHALENGLYNEAQELGKDEAEGSAATSQKTKKTMRGIDLGTVNHEGFDQDDDFYYGSREELGHAMGLSQQEMAESGFLTVHDPQLDNIIRAKAEVQHEVLKEIDAFYKEVEKNSEIKYTEILPAELEMIMAQDHELDLDIDLALESEKGKDKEAEPDLSDDELER